MATQKTPLSVCCCSDLVYVSTTVNSHCSDDCTIQIYSIPSFAKLTIMFGVRYRYIGNCLFKTQHYCICHEKYITFRMAILEFLYITPDTILGVDEIHKYYFVNNFQSWDKNTQISTTDM